jgi:hypothetical protein
VRAFLCFVILPGSFRREFGGYVRFQFLAFGGIANHWMRKEHTPAPSNTVGQQQAILLSYVELPTKHTLQKPTVDIILLNTKTQ